MTINCDCSDVYACAGDSFVREKTIRARKQHHCCECGDVIEKGEEYQVASGCWDGSWYHFKTCSFCVMLRDTYCPGGYIYGELAETIQECLGLWYPSDPATTGKDEPREPEKWQLRVLAEEKKRQENVERYGVADPGVTSVLATSWERKNSK